MATIIEQISKVLTSASVEHYCDPNIKNWKTKIYGPFNSAQKKAKDDYGS